MTRTWLYVPKPRQTQEHIIAVIAHPHLSHWAWNMVLVFWMMILYWNKKKVHMLYMYQSKYKHRKRPILISYIHTLHCIALHCITLHCIALDNIILHTYISSHHITSHYIALHTYVQYMCFMCVYDPCWNSNQTWGFRSIGTKSKTRVEEGGVFSIKCKPCQVNSPLPLL